MTTKQLGVSTNLGQNASSLTDLSTFLLNSDYLNLTEIFAENLYNYY